MFTCPVCCYAGMTDPPEDYNICECCGTEFGNDDEIKSHHQLRVAWVTAGSPWFYGIPPMNWDPHIQLQTNIYKAMWATNYYANFGQLLYAPSLNSNQVFIQPSDTNLPFANIPHVIVVGSPFSSKSHIVTYEIVSDSFEDQFPQHQVIEFSASRDRELALAS